MVAALASQSRIQMRWASFYFLYHPVPLGSFTGPLPSTKSLPCCEPLQSQLPILGSFSLVALLRHNSLVTRGNTEISIKNADYRKFMNIFICSRTRTRSLFQIVPIRVPNSYLSMRTRFCSKLFQIVPIWGEDRLWLCNKLSWGITSDYGRLFAERYTI